VYLTGARRKLFQAKTGDHLGPLQITCHAEVGDLDGGGGCGGILGGFFGG
jgi:hypothetical protein